MRIETRRVAGVLDPGALVAAVSAGAADVLWLDSMPSAPAPRRGGGTADHLGVRPVSRAASADQGNRERWSVVGVADGPFGATFVHEHGRPEVRVTPASEPWFARTIAELTRRAAVAADDRDEFFAVLEQLLDATPDIDVSPIPGCEFALGWIGYLGYELGRESGGPLRFADGHPDGSLRFVDRAVVIDARDDVTWVLALVVDDDDPLGSVGIGSAANRVWVDATARALAQLGADARGAVRTAGPEAASGDTVLVGAVPAEVSRVAPDAAVATTGLQADGRVSRARYERDVDACREEIRNGNAFQVCLTTSFSVGASMETAGARGVDAAMPRDGGAGPLLDAPEFAEYLRLRAADPVPFGSFLRLGRVTIASRSPERFLAVSASRRVIAEPIKGTRPRGRTRDEDEASRTALDTSGKDRAENVMIVDLLRNDLLRTAVPGSVHVERLCDIESYATVHQMVSTVVGTVRPGVSVAEVVRGAFPPGSMTGAPKISAMAIADRLEGAPRGVYSGAIGYFAMNGAVDLAVAIRTLVSVRHHGGDGGVGGVGDDGGVGGAERAGVVVRSLGAGGAVTWSSSAQDEADEVETKTRSVLGALGTVARW